MADTNRTNTILETGEIQTVPFAKIHRSHPRFEEVFRFYKMRGAGLAIEYEPNQELLMRQDNETLDLPVFQSVLVDTANARKLATRFITKRWFFKYEHQRDGSHKFTFSQSVDLASYTFKGLKFELTTLTNEWPAAEPKPSRMDDKPEAAKLSSQDFRGFHDTGFSE